MSLTFQQMKRMRDVAAGRIPADLLIVNARIVNTLTQEIHTGNLAIAEGYIVSFDGEIGNEVIDAEGMYISPLFIDAHMHIESTLLLPPALNDLLVPKGIGTIVADPHEIANVAGTDGIQFILDSLEGLDLDCYITLPSCVPATSFEHSGATLRARDLEPFYAHPHVIGLAEVMDYKSLMSDDDMLEKVYHAKKEGKCVDGHGAVLDRTGLDVYATLRIGSDHECVDLKGMQERLRRGIYTLIREASSAKNLKTLIQGVDRRNCRYICFCTDDRHPDDLTKEGGVDHLVRLAIAEGMDPIMAITLATKNAADCYRFSDVGAIAPGYRADFFLFKDLYALTPAYIYKKGRLIAQDGKILNPKGERSLALNERIMHSVNFKEYKVSDLQINLNEHRFMRMIEVDPNEFFTKLTIEEVQKNIFNQFVPSREKDQAKLVVIERHHATGHIGLCAIKGFGLKKGAIATSVSHDSHNIIAIGNNDFDIVMAIEQLRKSNGGYVVAVDGAIVAHVPLKIAGLMSVNSLKLVLKQLHELHNSVKNIVVKKDFNPFVMLSFISLPVIPEVRITDMGLVDVRSGKFLELAVDIDTFREDE